jgi:hypothetical protein
LVILQTSSEEEEMWVEAGGGDDASKKTKKNKAKIDVDVVSKPKAAAAAPKVNVDAKILSKPDDDNEWASFGNLLPTFTNDSKRTVRQKQKEEERMSKSIDKVIE